MSLKQAIETLRDEVSEQFCNRRRFVAGVLHTADVLHDKLVRDEISRDDLAGHMSRLIERCRDGLSVLDSLD